jgi:hypothetical protein
MDMPGPQVPIAVDADTGIWTTDGLPMIYMPRHFFVNHLQAFEAAMGADAFAKATYAAGHASAWQWCEKESKTHGLRGTDVFAHYMKRISQRGWGLFAIEALDRDTGGAIIALRHSVYVEHYGRDAGRKLCGAFDGWFTGALEWAGRDSGRDWHLSSHETQCAGMGRAHCVFEVRQAAR